jgi:hypothetical protein
MANRQTQTKGIEMSNKIANALMGTIATALILGALALMLYTVGLI